MKIEITKGIISHVTFWILFGLATMWIGKGKFKRPPKCEDNELRYPATLLLLGIITSGFFFGLAIASNTINKNSSTTIGTTIAFCLFGTLGVPFIVSYYTDKYIIDDDGITTIKFLRTPYRAHWTQICKVKYSKSGYITFKTVDSKTINISTMMYGIPHLAGIILEKIDKSKFDNDLFDAMALIAKQQK